MEVIVLSSSPLPVRSFTAANSPPPGNQQRVSALEIDSRDPSPSPTVSKRPCSALKSGSRAAPVPEDAITGFATAGSLVRSHLLSLDRDDAFPTVETAAMVEKHVKSGDSSGQPVKKRPGRPKKPIGEACGAPSATKTRQQKPKDVAVDGRQPIPVEKSRTRLAAPKVSGYFADAAENPPSNEAPPVDAPKPTKPTKPRKPRAKKDKSEKPDSQTKLKGAKVTKARSRASSTKDSEPGPREPRNRTTGAVPSHFEAKFRGEDGHKSSLTKDRQSRAHTVDVLDLTDSYGKNDTIWEVPSSSAPTNLQTSDSSRIVKGSEVIPVPAGDATPVKAIARRRDWTPVKDSRQAVLPADPEADVVAIEGPNNPSSIILSGFAYAPPNESDPTITSGMVSREGMTKRRRIELVEVPGNVSASRTTSPEKRKVPKKKARTITDLVTAQYADQPSNQMNHPGSVTAAFFNTKTTTVPLKDAPGPPAKSEKTTSSRKATSLDTSAEKGEKKPRRAKPKASSKPKPKPVANKLLSPASAALRFDSQNILFGTSSQLALEESPTLVRQIQAALRESEEDAAFSLRLRSPTRGKQSGLWSAAARNFDGDLLEPDDLVYMPHAIDDVGAEIPIMTQLVPDVSQSPTDYGLALGETRSAPPELQEPQKSASRDVSGTAAPVETTEIPQGSRENTQSSSVSTESDVQFVDDSLAPSPTPPPSLPNCGPTASSQLHVEYSLTDTDHYLQSPSKGSDTSALPDINELLPALKARPPSSIPLSRNLENDLRPHQRVTLGSKPAEKGLYSLRPPPRKSPAPIVHDIDDFPMKPVPPTPNAATRKPKAAWESQNIAAPASSLRPEKLSASHNLHLVTPKKTARRFDDVDEIMDSEDDFSLSPTPTPPHIPQLIDAPSLDLRPSSSKAVQVAKVGIVTQPAKVFKIPIAELKWDIIKDSVFSQITSTIRKLPRSTNSNEPTWHEKILMFHPIVLEDFTAWLNAETEICWYRRATVKQRKDDLKARREAAKAAGIKGRKALKEAVEGCETSEDDPNMVDAVKTKLEMWMVQQWCEKMSVCCISKEKTSGWRGKNCY